MPRSLTAPMVHSTDHEVVSSLGSSGSSGHDSDDTIPGFGSEKTTLALRPRPPLTPTPHEAWTRAGDTGARPYDHRTRGACQTGWLWPRRRTRWNRRSGDGTTWRNPHRPLGRKPAPELLSRGPRGVRSEERRVGKEWRYRSGTCRLERKQQTY